MWAWLTRQTAASGLKVLIAGNDSSGKTTLLYRAARGDLLRTIPTIGFNTEVLTPVPSVSIRAWDVGGADRIGLLYGHYLHDSIGLVFVIRPRDTRLWSALWELYWIVQQAVAQDPTASAGLAVCVVVPINESHRDLFRPWDRLGAEKTEGEDATFSLPTLTRMADRESLPPGGTGRWSRARRWSDVEGPDGEIVDSRWLSAWEAGRAQVLESGRTESHGVPVQHDPAASPPLSQLHTGPWTVLPIDMHARAADAMLPFKWIAANRQS